MAPPEQWARDEHKEYDENYFRKWYRNPRTRVHTPQSVRRKVRMVVGIAEYFLRRPVRSVLDIGAGEGSWRAELRRLRPEIRYEGVDPSEYVVRRYGSRRNIRLGSFEDLPALFPARPHPERRVATAPGRFDLIVCADVIQYVPTRVLQGGVRHIATLLNGIAYLESYTTGDQMEGDLSNWCPRTGKEYRRIYSAAGLVGCGLHCYMKGGLAERAVELELV